ncbi:hypothetical protein BDR05DRAFT_886446 [Suillus weaverae]|nr:hypothetical protein BDR05DRAFT_886446 [Suillus weaverae]
MDAVLVQQSHAAILIQQTRALHQRQVIQKENLRRHCFLLLIACIICQVSALYYQFFLTPPPKIPYHTSALTGQAWILELMTGHPDRI